MAKIIEFRPPATSHTTKLSYDPEKQFLGVTFKNGWTYTHSRVPADIFAAMTRWVSPGAYYHAVIKRHYQLIAKTPPEKAYNEPDDSQTASQ